MSCGMRSGTPISFRGVHFRHDIDGFMAVVLKTIFQCVGYRVQSRSPDIEGLRDCWKLMQDTVPVK